MAAPLAPLSLLLLKTENLTGLSRLVRKNAQLSSWHSVGRCRVQTVPRPFLSSFFIPLLPKKESVSLIPQLVWAETFFVDSSLAHQRSSFSRELPSTSYTQFYPKAQGLLLRGKHEWQADPWQQIYRSSISTQSHPKCCTHKLYKVVRRNHPIFSALMSSKYIFFKGHSESNWDLVIFAQCPTFAMLRAWAKVPWELKFYYSNSKTTWGSIS